MRVAVGSVPYVASNVTLLLEVDEVPPVASNDTSYWLTVQCAYSVWSDAVFTLVLSVTFEPPVSAVYQPSNV